MGRLLSLKSVAERCDVHPKTVARWVKDGQFPAAGAVLPGGGLRWWEHDVMVWLANREKPAPVAPPVKSK